MQIHEIKHAAEELRDNKKLDFYKGKLINHSPSYQEVKAYKAQYAYSPLTMPKRVYSMSDIRIGYVAGLIDEYGNARYPYVLNYYNKNKRALENAGG